MRNANGRRTRPARPRRGLRTTAIVAALAVIAVTLSASTGGAGPLQVDDPPCSQQPAGLIGHTASSVGNRLGAEVHGDYVFTAGFSGALEIYDVSDPCNPVVVSVTWLQPGGQELWGLKIVENLAFLANDYNGLQVYDVSDPEAPAFLGSRKDGRYANSAAYDGERYAYVAYHYSAGAELVVYDMTTFPSPPVATYDAMGDRSAVNLEVDFDTDRAYLRAQNGGDYFEIVDISDPENPTRVSTLALYDGTSQLYGTIGDIRVAGDHAYVATSSNSSGTVVGGLLVIDISDETTPTVASFHLMAADAGREWSTGLEIVGDRAYVGARSGLNIFDVSDPSNPALLETYGLPADFQPSRGGDVSIQGDLVYMTSMKISEATGGLAVFRTVDPEPPIITSVSGPAEPVSIDDQSAVTAEVNFVDPNATDTHQVEFDWGDDSEPDVVIDTTSPTTMGHTYANPGVYAVTVTVTDNAGLTDIATFEYVVIYDPSAGFVTGGGWINSPPGAYPADPTLTGTANFGFVSKYKKGADAPTGATEFQFHAGDLDFHSNSYDWLVIAGRDKAKFKGEGTINNTGRYGFMLTATDNPDGDTFRIKIWDKDNNDTIIYDNKLTDADDSYNGTPLGGGSIKIHKR